MVMNSRYAGRCKSCNNTFAAGTPIEWSRENGAKHTVCPVIVPAVVEPVTANAAPIAAFIDAAKARGLKFPKARFLAPNRTEMLLSLAGSTSKYPGSVQVKIAGNWIGRIEPTGTVAGPLANRSDVLSTLDTIAADPATAAKAYGALMCACSFCGKALTDAGSVEVGYGPICARHFGLPHTPKGTPVLVPLAA